MSQKINVNITPNSLAMPTLYFSQGDVGRVFTIEVVSSDGYDIPSGATVKIQATKPSGFGFSVTGTVTDNIVEFTSTSEMTDEAGRFFADLEITSGGTLIGTANFCMCGEADPHPDGTIDGSAESIVPQLTLLVERVENAAAAVLDTTTVATTLPAGSQATYSFDESTNTATFGIPQGEAGAGAAGVVASAYSASKTYAVGDYAIHNSNLYRCTTEIATAESFTAAHWTQVVLADDVTDLKSDINDIAEFETIYGKNKVQSDTITISGSVGATRNVSADVYLETDKEYRFQIWYADAEPPAFSMLSASEVTIRDDTDTTTLQTLVSWTAMATTGVPFTWEGETGLYKLHILSASSMSLPNSFYDGLFVYYDDLYPSAFEEGSTSQLAYARNALLLGGHSVNDLIESIDSVNTELTDLKTDITTNRYSANKLLYDTYEVTGSVGATRNVWCDVYLENGKEYVLRRMDGTFIAQSQIDITSYDKSSVIITPVNWTQTLTTSFIWSNETGLYKLHWLMGSAYTSPTEDIFNSLMIMYSSDDGRVTFVRGQRLLVVTDADKLYGYTLEEVLTLANEGLSGGISCVGDSLTQGAGAPAYNYVNQLNSNFLQGQTAYRFGVGGEGSYAIALRQGGIPAFVMPITIPATTDSVEIEVKDNMGNNVQYGAINGLLFGVSTCYIEGIKGTLSVDSSKTHTYFTRDEVGTAVTISRPTLLVSEIMQDHKNDTFIIWAGTNDQIASNGTEPTFLNIDDMIGFFGHNRYIVVGMTAQNNGMPNIDEINQKFANKYGSHFINVRRYLELYGLADNGLTDDSHSIYNDSAIPDALFDDGIHFNRYGYYSVAKCIYLFGKEKGYFN